MTRGRILALALVVVLAAPAHARAQFFSLVYDPAAVAQAILIAQRTIQVIKFAQEQRDLMTRMAARLPGLDRYGTPPYAPGRYDTSRFGGTAALLAALNDGDPGGVGWRASVRPIVLDPSVPLSPDVRAAVRRQLAALDAMDAIGGRGVHEAGMRRGTTDRLARLFDVLEADVLNGSPLQSTAAILDKLAAGGALARRQVDQQVELQAINVDLQLLTLQRQREAEAEAAAMHIGMREALAAPTSEGRYEALDWTTFRQP